MVPGSACCGSVAPIMRRTCSTAFGPSKTAAMSGPEGMKRTSPSRNGFPPAPAPRARGGAPRAFRPAWLEPREELSGEAELESFWLDKDQCAFDVHVTAAA